MVMVVAGSYYFYIDICIHSAIFNSLKDFFYGFELTLSLALQLIEKAEAREKERLKEEARKVKKFKVY